MLDVVLDFLSGLLSEVTNPQKRVYIGYLMSALCIAFLWLFFVEKLKIKDATLLIFNKKIWLSNLSSDPTEQVNLAQTAPGIAKHLFELLEAHHFEAAPPQYPSVIQGPVMIDKTLVDSYIDGDEYVYSPN